VGIPPANAEEQEIRLGDNDNEIDGNQIDGNEDHNDFDIDFDTASFLRRKIAEHIRELGVQHGVEYRRHDVKPSMLQHF
jgi:hypothetical protein